MTSTACNTRKFLSRYLPWFKVPYLYFTILHRIFKKKYTQGSRLEEIDTFIVFFVTVVSMESRVQWLIVYVGAAALICAEVPAVLLTIAFARSVQMLTR